MVIAQQSNYTALSDDTGSFKMTLANETPSASDTNFLITDSTIIVSYPGYYKRTMTVPEGDTLGNVYLPFTLNEITNLGYTVITPRKEIPSAVSVIDGEVMHPAATTNFKSMMQGRASGVQVTQHNGLPAAAADVQIRGMRSFIAGTEPLYIVDGVPIVSGSDGDGGGGIGLNYGYYNDPLANINPEDIEDIKVLKDAGAVALYGARGANGVVLVETKKGLPGKTKISAQYYAGVTSATNKVDVMDANQYRSAVDAAYANTIALTGDSACEPQQILKSRYAARIGYCSR